MYRHLQEARSRATNLVDFLVDPDDEAGLKTLLRWVDREARAADSDKIRTFSLHAGVQARASPIGLLRRQVDDGVHREGEPGLTLPANFYSTTDRLARHARRFRSGPMTPMEPYLLVGIDTEGDNQWDLKSREHQTFENIYALPKLHSLFGRHGVRPTYVVTWPVASDERSQQVLRVPAAAR